MNNENRLVTYRLFNGKRYLDISNRLKTNANATRRYKAVCTKDRVQTNYSKPSL